jgi:ribosomal protein S18 acetylase RimI-like enzyme
MREFEYEHVHLPDKPTLDGLRVSRWAAQFVESKAVLNEATDAILARQGQDVIGLFLYSLDEHTLYTHGTYVERRYRRRGIATRMWSEAIEEIETRPRVSLRRVVAVTISRDGARFVERGARPTVGVSIDHDRNF